MPAPAPTTVPTKRRSLTPWELPSLLTPLHAYRRAKRKTVVDRPHFAAILGFVYRNRVAVASQVQRRFATILRSDRTARRHLEEMEALGYLGVVSARAVGPLFPKVFFVTGKGVKRLRATVAARGKAWQPTQIDRRSRHSNEGYSADHVLHEVLLTEFLLAVWQTVQGRPDLQLLTIQRRSLAKHPSFAVSIDGRETSLQPDALFVFKQHGNGMICSFVELDTGVMNLPQMRGKYGRYDAWAQSETGQAYLVDLYRRFGATDPRPSFRVLLVADDRTMSGGERRMGELFRTSLAVSPAMRDRLWFTTVADLRARQGDALPLAPPIWKRGRDARSWTTVRAATVTASAGESPRRQGRAAMALRLDALPSHPLFPHPPGDAATG